MTPPHPSGTNGSSDNGTSTSLKSSSLNHYGSTLREGSTPPEPKGNWSFLLLLLPVLCCGGPFLVLTLAAAGTATIGVTAGIFVALVAAAALILVRRQRAANCCVTPSAKDCQ